MPHDERSRLQALLAGAAVAGGKIYVVGGTDGQAILAANAEYRPENEGTSQNPWNLRAPLPQGSVQAAQCFGYVGGSQVVIIRRQAVLRHDQVEDVANGTHTLTGLPVVFPRHDPRQAGELVGQRPCLLG